MTICPDSRYSAASLISRARSGECVSISHEDAQFLLPRFRKTSRDARVISPAPHGVVEMTEFLGKECIIRITIFSFGCTLTAHN